MQDSNLTPDSDSTDGASLDLPLQSDSDDDIASRIDLEMDFEPTPEPKPESAPIAEPKKEEPLVELTPVEAPIPSPAVVTPPPLPPAPKPTPPVSQPVALAPLPVPADDEVLIISDIPTARLPVAKRLKAVPQDSAFAETKPAIPGWHVVAGRGDGTASASAWGTVGGWTVLAVSDGAGSRLACDTAVAQVTKLFAGCTLAPSDSGQPSDRDVRRVRAYVADAADQTRRALVREAKARSVLLEDLDCSLLLVVHTAWADGDVVAAVQVGGGVIGLLSADGAKPFGDPDREPRSLMSPGIEQELERRVLFALPIRLTAIALGNSAVAADFAPLDRRLGEMFTNGGAALRSRPGDRAWILMNRPER